MTKWQSLVQFWSGKKTYTLGVIGATIAVLLAFGIIVLSTQQLFAIAFLLAALFGVTLRDAINSLSVPTQIAGQNKTK